MTKPLALYVPRTALSRWALPALCVAIVGQPSGAGAQSFTSSWDSVSPVQAHYYRDPRLARRLGRILPGAGHMYAGEYVRGYYTFVITGSALAFSALMLPYDCPLPLFDLSPCTFERRWENRLIGASFLAGSVLLWVTSAKDAPHAAERANARHGRSVTPHVVPTIGSGHLGVRVGVEISP
jgi:hypothetical protein